jgi:hypothetical protein
MTIMSPTTIWRAIIDSTSTVLVEIFLHLILILRMAVLRHQRIKVISAMLYHLCTAGFALRVRPVVTIQDSPRHQEQRVHTQGHYVLAKH